MQNPTLTADTLRAALLAGLGEPLLPPGTPPQSMERLLDSLIHKARQAKGSDAEVLQFFRTVNAVLQQFVPTCHRAQIADKKLSPQARTGFVDDQGKPLAPHPDVLRAVVDELMHHRPDEISAATVSGWMRMAVVYAPRPQEPG